MKDVDRERQALDDKKNTLATEHDLVTAENLKLKSLTFDFEYRLNHYTIMVDQAQ